MHCLHTDIHAYVAEVGEGMNVCLLNESRFCCSYISRETIPESWCGYWESLQKVFDKTVAAWGETIQGFKHKHKDLVRKSIPNGEPVSKMFPSLGAAFCTCCKRWREAWLVQKYREPQFLRILEHGWLSKSWCDKKDNKQI